MKVLKTLLFMVVLLVPFAAARKTVKKKPAPKPPASPGPAVAPTGKIPADQASYLWPLRFDDDGDYSVFEVEWLQGWGQAFAALDTNSDGILTADELKGADEEAIKELHHAAQLFIARLDWRKDGVLFKDEWAGFLDEYLAWDANGDGKLSGDEIVGACKKNVSEYSTPAPLNKMDTHADSRIDSDEWMEAAQKLFRKLDKNKNGRLDASDFS